MLNQKQKEAIESPSNRIIINASAGTGKSLKNGSRVLSQRGWIEIENLSLEDVVAGMDGNFYNVLGIYPQEGDLQVCEVIFSDRTKIYCSLDHLWFYQTAYMRSQNQLGVKTIKEIKEEIPLKIKSGKYNKNNCYIPMTKPVLFKKQNVPLDPYLLGCLLGDGCLSQNGIRFTVEQEDLKEMIIEILKEYDCSLKYRSQYDYQLFGELGYGYNCTQNKVGAAIRELNLSRTKSNTKFIPNIYKYNTEEVRIGVLQGLIDTDGYCEGSSYDIILKSKQMILDIKEICESLGLTATYSEKKSKCTTVGYEKNHGIVYRLHIKTSQLFPKLHRTKKREKQWKRPQAYARRHITEINYLNEYSKMTCIKVASPDSSFLCENFIVTHNTTTIISAAEVAPFNSNILITFTNKAADEMKKRLTYNPEFIGTIHRFSRQELYRLARLYNFRVRILKESSIKKIIKTIFEENDFGIYVSNILLSEAFRVITNDDIEFDARKMKIFREVKKLYQKYKEQNQLFDLTDTPKYLLKKLNDLNLTLNYDLVLIDEAQDLDEIQYNLIQKLGKRIIAIGDPKQSIYLFRGATPQIFDRFAAEGYESHTLDINYRSKQEIIDNVGVNLICDRGYGGEVLNDTRILDYGPMILCRTNKEVDEIKKLYPSVMTVHAAKGLEFNNVCISDFKIQSEEDENIMFVALTRARDRVGVIKYSDILKWVYNF